MSSSAGWKRWGAAMAASETPDPQSSCFGKCCLTADRAHKIARRISKRVKSKMDAYRCAHCGAWHVGAHPRRPFRKRRPVK